MINAAIRHACPAALLAGILFVSGCAQNVRIESADTIALQVKHRLTPDNQGMAWFAPELHISQYRTLFYGYDTLDYRLAAPDCPNNAANDNFRLMIDVRYGGNIRHYDLASPDDAANLEINHLQHFAERCQIFNSLISSCIYQDRLSVSLSRSDLEKVRNSGLKLLLSSGVQPYETIDLPKNYIQGFLKAIDYGYVSNSQKP